MSSMQDQQFLGACERMAACVLLNSWSMSEMNQADIWAQPGPGVGAVQYIDSQSLADEMRFAELEQTPADGRRLCRIGKMGKILRMFEGTTGGG